MGIFRKYVNQTRKPEGFMGKMMIKGMNVGHSKVADWGISHLQSMEPKAILEIGCGLFSPFSRKNRGSQCGNDKIRQMHGKRGGCFKPEYGRENIRFGYGI